MRSTRLRRLLGATALVALALIATTLWTLRQPPAIALDSRGPATVLVLAGDGVAGVRDGDAARARFSDPFGIAAAADGTIYVADAGDAQRIRKISPDGRVATSGEDARIACLDARRA